MAANIKDPIFIVKQKKTHYKTLNTLFLLDDRLSWKAKGILGYLLSKPENWRGQRYNLVWASKDGERSVKSGLKELVDTGYAELKILPRKDGKFQGKYYEISDTPGKVYAKGHKMNNIEPFATSIKETKVLEPWMDGALMIEANSSF
jgi:hypothetical protein